MKQYAVTCVVYVSADDTEDAHTLVTDASYYGLADAQGKTDGYINQLQIVQVEEINEQE